MDTIQDFTALGAMHINLRNGTRVHYELAYSDEDSRAGCTCRTSSQNVTCHDRCVANASDLDSCNLRSRFSDSWMASDRFDGRANSFCSRTCPSSASNAPYPVVVSRWCSLGDGGMLADPIR